jgi:hypothetical protein
MPPPPRASRASEAMQQEALSRSGAVTLSKRAIALLGISYFGLLACCFVALSHDVLPDSGAVLMSKESIPVTRMHFSTDPGGVFGFVACPPGVPHSRVGSHLPIDIVLKTHAKDVDLLVNLYRSLALFWESYESLVLVLDNPWEVFIAPIDMPRARWILEPLRHPALANTEGYYVQMWSNLWADNYTSAPLVAIIDADCVLINSVDRASLTYNNELVMRVLRCQANTTAPEASTDGLQNWKESKKGCLYAQACEYLLKIPCLGNFMVEVSC